MGRPFFQAGDTCGGNEVVRLIGAGGFSEVYEVIDPGGAKRALKVLATEASQRHELAARMTQEGALLTLIEHVNVVRLYDAGLSGEHLWLLLELVTGKNLREALRGHGGRLPVDAALRWIRQACDGVAEAHRVGAIHRDLKPENILVTSSELVKVIDFGMAKLSTWGVMTTQEQRVGTALYMSPEHIEGKRADPRMDIYSMGLVLYEALSGQHPICGAPESVLEICARQLRFQPPPLSQVARHVPRSVEAIVQKAIEKDPTKRFASMSEFSTALRDVLIDLTARRRAAMQMLLGTEARGAAPGGPLADTEDATTRVGTARPPNTETTDAPTMSRTGVTRRPGRSSQLNAALTLSAVAATAFVTTWAGMRYSRSLRSLSPQVAASSLVEPHTASPPVGGPATVVESATPAPSGTASSIPAEAASTASPSTVQVIPRPQVPVRAPRGEPSAPLSPSTAAVSCTRPPQPFSPDDGE